jgi:hypothetical protein
MFYFNDSLVAPSELDSEQIARVLKFKAKIGGELGVLYGTYSKVEDFERYVRLHLGKVIKEFRENWGSSLKVEKKDAEVIIPVVNDDNGKEEGSLESATTATKDEIEVSVPIVEAENIKSTEESFEDLLLSALDDIDNANAAMTRIGDIMGDSDRITKERIQEIKQIPRPRNQEKVDLIVNRYADDLNNFVERLKAEIPVSLNSYRSGLDKWIKLAQLSMNFDNPDKGPIIAAIKSTQLFGNSVMKARKSTEELQIIIKRSPQLTAKFNNAKENYIEILGELIKEYQSEEDLNKEANRIFNDISLKE